MKVLFHNCHTDLNKDNLLFSSNNVALGDDLLYPYRYLYEKCRKLGIELTAENDLNNIQDAKAIFFIDYPVSDTFVRLIESNCTLKKYLIIFETDLHRRDNWNKKNHDKFDVIYTWNDKLVDGEKYKKIYFPNKFHKNIKNQLAFSEKKLCVMLASQKVSSHRQELYSRRLQLIKWFEKSNPQDFDFYGYGWDIHTFSGPRFIRGILNRIKPLRSAAKKNYQCYRGSVLRKSDVLNKYKFSICYENSENMTGYITEKIFDSFFNGVVPVYRGAENISEYIPNNCFIDDRRFNSFEELYQFMLNMGEDEYLFYIANIEKYLKSKQGQLYSEEKFSSIILDAIEDY